MAASGLPVSNVEQPHVKVTLQTIYDKQLDNEKLLVRTLERLDGLSDVPDRLRAVEIAQARSAWVERIAYSALVGAIISIGTIIISSISKG
jgi:hypothetical protein